MKLGDEVDQAVGNGTDIRPVTRLLIANRGEIAIRIARAAADMGIETVAVHATDDAASRHVRAADAVVALPGRGVAAYLDAGALLDAAVGAGCDAVHPGYGFLAEDAAFAAGCAARGLRFVGPDPESLATLGDKTAARALAARLGVPLLAGTDHAVTLEEAQAFLHGAGRGGAMLKALAGGGGRGMRIVESAEALPDLYARCASEAERAFGNGALYIEQFLPRARHIEVQVIGDGTGAVSHLGERECTLQRRHQKIVEIAPSPDLPETVRRAICGEAVRMAQSLRYRGLGTFEFLIDADDPARFYFMEANPRIQVEHSVTEEVTGVDLVQAQIRVAGGARLADIGLMQADVPAASGFAMQMRVNLERMDPGGAVLPSAGTITTYHMPSGPGVRVDDYGYAGYASSPAFDPLIAKLIVRQGGVSDPAGFARLVGKARRVLAECRIGGVESNLPFLRALMAHRAVAAHVVTTRFVEQEQAALIAAAAGLADPEQAADAVQAEGMGPAMTVPEGALGVFASSLGVLVSIDVAVGDAVRAGQGVAVVEAMKMEHVATTDRGGVVEAICAAPGDILAEGALLAIIRPDAAGEEVREEVAQVAIDAVPERLAEVIEAQALLSDERRPDAVARRRRTGLRTARENIADLCDADSFTEYGGLGIAAQRRRFPEEELRRMSPADGLITGIASINGATFAPDRSRCMVMSYDYTVFAGTQGHTNHKKMDRMFGIAAQERLPLVMFTEGGGGRPSDTDHMWVAGGETSTFARLGRLSGRAPMIGIAAGRCFAGNAAVLGCCDLIIATQDSTIGMGGPAMIEGGGLGVYKPEEVGPSDVMTRNGVIDILVADEAEGVEKARQYLGYFQGALADWDCADQRLLRHIVPENRRRPYQVRDVMHMLADSGSVLELRPLFGRGMVTALARIEGRPFGIIANDTHHLAGAIDSDGADKAARFLELCGTFALPVVSLCDTPGFMVGPECEKTASVRHFSRMFIKGAAIGVPWMTVVLRKGYGLGSMAMGGGGFHEGLFTVAWPTGEFGGMGLEGAVRLGYRKELDAIADPAERQALYEKMVADAYLRGKALNVATYYEIDDVIDPADTRRRIAQTLNAHDYSWPERGPRGYVDPW
ncbi:MAG: carboxyl transferase domain-containing protein [Sphingobium sp.]